MLKQFLISLFIFLPVASLAGTPITFTSPDRQTTLIELYTSEGCSSCPPADRWLSTLVNDPRLWTEIIPVAFHVDYWNYLGWKDEFSKAEYSQRQRNYARWDNVKTVYTPGFLQNGKEWRGWFRSRSINTALGERVGPLTVTIDAGVVTAEFKPVRKLKGQVVLNVVWLGFGQETEVQSGENEGKKLKHDFVSHKLKAIEGRIVGDAYRWEFDAETLNLPVKKGMAFWLTNGNNPTPIQATGGWL